MHYNFILSGGGLFTLTNSRGSYFIKWSERVIVIPVRAAGTYYNIDCPTSAITITRFPSNTTFNATHGFPMTTFEALYYEIPIANSSFATVNANFVLVSYLSSSWIPKHNWVLLAVMNSDGVGGGVKWTAGNIVVPLPSTGNTNTWSPNITQLGTGANQLTINGSTGLISAPTMNATSLQEGGVDIDTIFMKKPWVQCVINANGTILSNSSVGQQTPTISRTSGQAAGAWDISFSAHPNSFNYTHYVQIRTDSGLGFGVVSNVSSGSCKVRLYNSSFTLTDYQFSFVIFS